MNTSEQNTMDANNQIEVSEKHQILDSLNNGVLLNKDEIKQNFKDDEFTYHKYDNNTVIINIIQEGEINSFCFIENKKLDLPEGANIGKIDFSYNKIELNGEYFKFKVLENGGIEMIHKGDKYGSNNGNIYLIEGTKNKIVAGQYFNKNNNTIETIEGFPEGADTLGIDFSYNTIQLNGKYFKFKVLENGGIEMIHKGDKYGSDNGNIYLIKGAKNKIVAGYYFDKKNNTIETIEGLPKGADIGKIDFSDNTIVLNGEWFKLRVLNNGHREMIHEGDKYVSYYNNKIYLIEGTKNKLVAGEYSDKHNNTIETIEGFPKGADIGKIDFNYNIIELNGEWFKFKVLDNGGIEMIHEGDKYISDNDIIYLIEGTKNKIAAGYYFDKKNNTIETIEGLPKGADIGNIDFSDNTIVLNGEWFKFKVLDNDHREMIKKDNMFISLLGDLFIINGQNNFLKEKEEKPNIVKVFVTKTKELIKEI